MPVLNESTTLGEIVAANPLTARVFELLGLDYCCGGAKPLADACAAKGLETASVVAQVEAVLAEPSPERDWTNATMTELADHIEETHHAYLRRELPRQTGLINKVVRAHGERHPELGELATVFAGFCAELSSHMMKEEQVLFPWLRRLESGDSGASHACASVTAPVAQMMHEHDDAGAALEKMRELTDGFTPPDGACGTYRALYASLAELELDLHRHIHKENSILFPMGVSAEAAASGSAPTAEGGCCGCDTGLST
jgi:regulator of cell morphogenesis and NO signaling